ncbi:endopeptidase La [Flavobacteriaceae bacterium]|nr:endopeptidase La [Flavobacteriaceae bacterium]
MTKSKATYVVPAVPLRDLVIFPSMMATIIVGRERSLHAIKEAKKNKSLVFFVAQKAEKHEKFLLKNIYRFGTLCEIVEYLKTKDDSIELIVRGVKKSKVNKIIDNENFSCAEIEEHSEQDNKDTVLLDKALWISFIKYAKYDKRLSSEIIALVEKQSSNLERLYKICQFINCKYTKKQKIFEESDIVKKFQAAIKLVKEEVHAVETSIEIAKGVQDKINKGQKELYLNEQLKYIKKELNKGEEDELAELKKNLLVLDLPKEAREKTNSELKKLEKANPLSSEAGISRSYLDLILELPWNKNSTVNSDIQKAENILDKNHYALEKAKDAILEFIAVQIKSKAIHGQIICLAGPPGVGKTSLAKSIAESLNRKYVKISLGGVRDESEIRGHRKTYIGAMPGKIINSMKKVKVSNPLILLDEIDKMASDFRGDPASAMLEVLDPEQNKNFNDHYLEVEYDLSKIMFIATANDISSIPSPLRDRMEIIKISGYTETEKLQICKKHLVPKLRKHNALTAGEFKISDKAILQVIRHYTFEAGIRNLEREITKLARKLVRKIVRQKTKSINFTDKNIGDFLGPEKFDFGRIKKQNQVGVSTGLAYTAFGGDLLDIEVIKFAGDGKIKATGKLGEVMQESTQTAFSYIKSVAKDLKIKDDIFKKYDFHIHFPEGATPKDGPSAGIAICLSIASCACDRPIDKDLAITGEVTLTGKALAIGGLKEKLLAALRGGIKNILIPHENKKNIVELPQEIKDNLNIKTIKTAKEAFKIGLI